MATARLALRKRRMLVPIRTLPSSGSANKS
jgi:hypothetical protein